MWHTDLYNLDCIAGGETFRQLISSDDLTNKSKVYTCASDGTAKENLDDEESVRSTPPSTTRSTTPAATTRTSPPRTPSSPPNTGLGDSWCYQGGKQSRFDTRARRPVDKRWQYKGEDEILTLPYTKSGPVMKPATPDHTVAYIQLGNEDALTSFCNVVVDGWPTVASPKKTPSPPGIMMPSPHHSGSPNSPLTTDLHDTWCYQGGENDRFDTSADCPVDNRCQFNTEEEIWNLPNERSGPDLKAATPDHTIAYIKFRVCKSPLVS